MVRILVVEDSPVAAELLKHILVSEPGFEVVGHVVDGESAVEEVSRLRPDVVTMDIHLPGMDGFATTRRIMETTPTRIVVVSGTLNTNEVDTSLKALEAGALTVVKRPVGPTHPEFAAESKQLVRMVRLMSEIKVVRRYSHNGKPQGQKSEQREELKSFPSEVNLNRIKLIAIGASTGGPQILHAIFEKLPGNFPLPIIVVQHMSTGFMEGYTEWLKRNTNLSVRLANDGDRLLPGTVYFAPDEIHMRLKDKSTLELKHADKQHGIRPSISCLFDSIAELCGERTLAILLTGMGKDGAEELLKIRQAGGFTIAQDEPSSVVYGMPKEAVRLGAAIAEMNPAQITELLLQVSSAQAK